MVVNWLCPIKPDVMSVIGTSIVTGGLALYCVPIEWSKSWEKQKDKLHSKYKKHHFSLPRTCIQDSL